MLESILAGVMEDIELDEDMLVEVPDEDVLVEMPGEDVLVEMPDDEVVVMLVEVELNPGDTPSLIPATVSALPPCVKKMLSTG